MLEYIIYIQCLFVACVFLILTFKTRNFIKYYSKFYFFIIWSEIAAVFLIPVMLINTNNIENLLIYPRSSLYVLRALGITWQLRNKKVLTEEKEAIVIANHQSALDVLASYHIICVAKKIAPVCKREIFYMGPFGLAAYIFGCILINRRNPKDAHRLLKTSADKLFKNKGKLLMFPEGTRSKNSLKLQPFKKGAFTLAIASQVPIIPVVISPYYFLDAQKYIFDKGHVIIQCLESVSTEGLTMDDMPELIARVRNVMEDTYEELRKEIS